VAFDKHQVVARDTLIDSFIEIKLPIDLQTHEGFSRPFQQNIDLPGRDYRCP